jgi:tRNA(Ile)-lysidine synthase
MSLSAAALRALVRAQVPSDARALIVALSGGADSAALLAALADRDQEPLPWPLRAVHIDHGLQPAAEEFRDACAAQCRRLGIELTVKRVNVQILPGDSLEAKAREARYAALELEVSPGDCLITAHHAMDQAETLLLQGLRGAGLKGLSAMPWRKIFGRGLHVRPLLDVRREDLVALGAALQAGGCEDPMNRDPRYDRSYLRQALWPQVLERWPGAASALARTARHAAEAQDFIDSVAARDLSDLRDGEALSLPALRGLGAARRLHAVRLWLHEAEVEPPSEARLVEALRQMFEAKSDHQPAVPWGEHALRRYRQRLFLTPRELTRLQGAHRLPLQVGARLELGLGLGVLVVEALRGGLDGARCSALMVRGRVGGERLKPAAAAKTQSVQHLCQALGVLPWMRDALPFLYVEHVEQKLAAVGDLWLDAGWCVAANQAGVGVRWENAPNIV